MVVLFSWLMIRKRIYHTVQDKEMATSGLSTIVLTPFYAMIGPVAAAKVDTDQRGKA